MTGPFTSERCKVIPPSFSRRLIASRLSSAEESICLLGALSGQRVGLDLETVLEAIRG